MKSSYVDVPSIVQVIGCVFNEPSILEDNIITEEDFVEDFHKIIFGSIYNIYATGSDVTLDAIVDYLSNRPKYEAVFNKNKGTEYLLEASQQASKDTFKYYYGRLKKMTLLRMYDNLGISVRDLYDPDEVLDTKKRQNQEDWFDNITLRGIAEAIDKKIEGIKLKYVEDDVGNSYQAGDDVDNLIDSFKKNPELGIAMYGTLINTVTKGARLGKVYMRSAATGQGKAIPNDTIIPTPNGNKRVDEIRVGDYLWGDDGKPTLVKAVYPQKDKKQVYLVKFSDGREARCCSEHLWEYMYKGHGSFDSSRVETTQQILARSKGVFKASGYKYRVKLNAPVQYPKANLPIDPYVMGLMFGDGSFRQQDSSKSLSYSSVDEELPAAIAEIMGWTYLRNSEHNYTYTFKCDGKRIYVEEFLASYPQLFNTYSYQKYIPREYLEASIEQRYALLQGLMDTDGHIDSSGKGRTNFSNTSLQLINDMVELCHSLGFITTVSQDKYTENCYTVYIQCPKSIKPKLFRLKRKHDLAVEYSQSSKRSEHKDYIAIESITALDEYVDMTCFTVDNNSHLFLMNDFIVTHNTRAMVADACYFGCDRVYHEQFGWIRAGSRQPTLYIATEQDKSEIQTMMLAFISGVNEDSILNGRYAEGEEERVREAAQILKNSPIWIEELPDFSLKDVENTIKRYIRDHSVKYICHDYIFTSMKILEEITRRSGGVRLREDNILFMLGTKLKDIAIQNGVFILTSTQLSGDWRASETPDQGLLRGAKSLGDKIDIGMIMLPVSPEDIAKIEPVLATGRFKIPNMKISVYKNRRGAYTGIYLWARAELGICRIDPQFATTWHYDLVSIEDIKIITEDEEPPWN